MSHQWPPLYADPDLGVDVDEPRTNTATYFTGGRAFGAPLAEPATDVERRLRAEIADLKTRLVRMTGHCASAVRDTNDAMERERGAIADREISEARLEIAQGVALRALERMRKRSSTIEAALDRAARTITGRSHAQVVADLDLQVSEHRDDDTEVVEVETKRERPRRPMYDGESLDRIAMVIRHARANYPGLSVPQTALLGLAGRVRALLRAERRADLAQRVPGGEVPYQLLEDIDEAQRALARAVPE
jgi:hypothetical protein